LSFRDRVIEINREIGSVGDVIFDVFFDACEWFEPFVPWVIIGGVFFAVFAVCFL
jgi:hypothetical protein